MGGLPCPRSVTRENVSFRAVVALPDWVAQIVLALVLLILLGPYLVLSGRDIALADDAYYYLVPASRFWELGFYSFDGLTGTNGFHPLWMLLLTGCALPLHFMGMMGGLPRVALWLCIVLIVWGSVLWYGVLRRGGVARVHAALTMLVGVIATQSLLLQGLETAAVFWSLALLARYLMLQIQAAEPLHPGWLAFYSLLVLFSRLDCGLFLLLLYGLLLFYAGPRRVVIAGLLLTLFATPYLALNVVHHGGVTPISGRVKQHWGDRYELETVGKQFGLSREQLVAGPGKYRLRQITRTYLPRDSAPTLRTLTLNQLPESAQKAWTFPLLIAGLILAAIRLGMTLRRTVSPSTRFLAYFAGALGLFYAVSTVYYALSYDRVWPWYGAVGVMLMAAGLTFLMAGLLRFRYAPYVQGAVLIVLLVFWSTANRRSIENATRNLDRSLRGVQLELADWLTRNTPSDAVAAGWAVGEMGWFAERSVINLEGLISDQELFQANQATDILPFLAQHNVTYVSNFWRPSYAPLPEDLLARAASGVLWKDPLVRYFWTLRLRAMMDCPEAFSVVHRHDIADKQETSGYVLRVDQGAIARYLAARAAWREAIATCATTLPAERYDSVRIGKQEANIPRAEGYFVRSADLAYRLDDLAPGSYALYGRVCNLYEGEGTLTWSQGGHQQHVAIPSLPQWQHVRLGTLAHAAGDALRIEAMSGELYLDQLYFVAPEQRSAFEALSADW